MANIYTYQVLKDTTERAIIKITGLFDGVSGQESNAARITANTLYGALATNGFPVANIFGGAANTSLSYYDLQIFRVWYDTTNNSNNNAVELFWRATNNKTIFYLSGTYEYDAAGNWVTVPNNAANTPGVTGDIGVNTYGMVANSSYTIVLDVRKNNAQYQRGQFNDPAAFNFNQYSIKP